MARIVGWGRLPGQHLSFPIKTNTYEKVSEKLPQNQWLGAILARPVLTKL
jgi:hypothetical protein